MSRAVEVGKARDGSPTIVVDGEDWAYVHAHYRRVSRNCQSPDFKEAKERAEIIAAALRAAFEVTP